MVALVAAARSTHDPSALVRWLSLGLAAAFLAILWEVQARLSLVSGSALLGENGRTVIWIAMAAIALVPVAFWVFYR